MFDLNIYLKIDPEIDTNRPQINPKSSKIAPRGPRGAREGSGPDRTRFRGHPGSPRERPEPSRETPGEALGTPGRARGAEKDAAERPKAPRGG